MEIENLIAAIILKLEACHTLFGGSVVSIDGEWLHEDSGEPARKGRLPVSIHNNGVEKLLQLRVDGKLISVTPVLENPPRNIWVLQRRVLIHIPLNLPNPLTEVGWAPMPTGR